jgi:hypothetical protein
MKKAILISSLLLCAAFVFAQEGVGAPQPERIGVEAAQQQLKEVSVDRFERDGYWFSTMSTDDGYTQARLFEGNAPDKTAIPDEEGQEIPDRYVLGTKVSFLRRGRNTFTITPTHPIPIEGVTKTISVRVAGRNFNHVLKVMVEDIFGKRYDLYMDKLNFTGWKLLTVAVPPAAADGKNGIIQKNNHFNDRTGIKIVGFKVECDPEDAYGTYYIYLDDLRAVTDLFAESTRDPSDIVDTW